jgi:hypothetical protein
MPQEQGYERRVGSVTPAALPQASAAAFGAGIGQSVSEMGDVLHRRDVQKYQIERQQTADSESADAALKLADVRQRLDAARDQARAAPDAGAAGHVAAMEAAFDREVSGITDGITEDRVRRNLSTQIADYRSNFVSGENTWKTVYAAKTSVTNLGVLNEKASARVFMSSDPNVYGQESTAWDDAVDTRSDIGADQKEAVRRDGHAALAIAYAGRRERDDPKGLISDIDGGSFNDVLDAKQLDRLRAGAEAQVRMVEAQQKALAAAQVTATREQLATKRAELDTGAGKPQDWATLAQQYEAIGDTSAAVTARAAGEAKMAALTHQGDGMDALDSQISTLTAKQGRGGLSTAEAATLTGITALRSQKAQRLGQPGGALLDMEFMTGRPIAPLDPADPASVRLRGQQAAQAAQLAGRPNAIEPFKPTELPAMKDLMENGAGGRIQVLQTLAAFGDARVIDGAARQVSGSGDGAFRVASRMLTYPAGQAVATAIVRGDELRGKQPWPEKAQRQARADFMKYYGGAMRGGDLPPGFVNDLFDGAMGFYASRANGGAYDAGRFAEATEAVLGRNGGRGGVARVPGQGIVIAPPTMSPEAMMTRFARAKGEDYQAAAGGRAPVYSDGSHLTRGALRTMLPTMLADGRYGFRGANGALLHDDRGGIYAVDLHRLPAR